MVYSASIAIAEAERFTGLPPDATSSCATARTSPIGLAVGGGASSRCRCGCGSRRALALPARACGCSSSC